MDPAERQAVLDQEHLRWLAIAYYVSAGLSAFVGLIMVAYFGFMATVLQVAAHDAKNAPPAFVGALLGLFCVFLFLVLGVMTWAKVQTGRNLRRRRSRTFCMVVGGIVCMGFPWGTLLGIATLLVLSRPTVVAMFETAP
jgi:hypothetical protein